MASYLISGGKTLHGSISVNAGKNSPVAVLCATLIVRGKVVLKDISRVEEVDRIVEILMSIGVVVEWRDEQTLFVDTSPELTLDTIDQKACKATRASLLLFGALASRERSYRVYKSGGCKLGERTIRPHLFALRKLGIEIASRTGWYEVASPGPEGAPVVMYESSDTATENVIMAAVLARGRTVIKFASANYMVQDLCYFLVAAGAKIEGIGTTTLAIIGVKALRDVKEYYIVPDPVDAMALISLAITTKSPLIIKNCAIDFLELELEHLEIMGQKYARLNPRKSHSGHFDLVDIQLTPSKLVALPDKLHGRPYPGINIDNIPLFVPILTQAKGRTLVHDWVYENRALYYLELQKLGAQVILLDPHRVFIEGPTQLQPNEVICPPAIRPAMAIFIAMLAAKGKSVLRHVYPIERAYDQLLERLHHVGADITRVE